MNKYQYEYFDELPKSFWKFCATRVLKEDVDKTFTLCKYNTHNNHHFNPTRYMSDLHKDKYLKVVSIQNRYNGDGKWHIVRQIHKNGNHKYVEFVELYLCSVCEVWCVKKTYHLPSKVYQAIL